MSDIGNKAVFAANLKWYMEMKDVNQADVCRDLGFKTTAFSAWMTAKAYPRIDKIEKLANYFHISKSDLIESKKPAAPDWSDELADENKKLFAVLTAEQQREVLRYQRYLLQQK